MANKRKPKRHPPHYSKLEMLYITQRRSHRLFALNLKILTMTDAEVDEVQEKYGSKLPMSDEEAEFNAGIWRGLWRVKYEAGMCPIYPEFDCA